MSDIVVNKYGKMLEIISQTLQIHLKIFLNAKISEIFLKEDFP
jgi:hypothetical protein